MSNYDDTPHEGNSSGAGGTPQEGPYGTPQYGQSGPGQPNPGQPLPPVGGPTGPGTPAGQSRTFSVGEAFNYGWTKFQANVGPIILAVLAIVVVSVVIQVIGFVVTGAMAGAGTPTIEYNQVTGQFVQSGGSGGLLGASFFLSMLFGFITYAFALVVQSGIIKGSLAITYGRRIDFKEMFAGLDFVQIVIASLIIGVATTVGFMLCVLPGFAVMFFTWFTLYFIIDQKMSALDAIKASASFVNKNMGSLIGFFLGAVVAYFVGALLCGLGLLIAIPVVIIAQAYTYRTLRGETVTA